MFSANMQCSFLDLCHQFGYDVAAKIYAKDAILLEPPAVPTNNPNAISTKSQRKSNKQTKKTETVIESDTVHTHRL